MKLDIMYIISERDKREREKRERELDEGRRLPLYIEPPCNGEKGVEDEEISENSLRLLGA
jgi:hypothetical protein